MNDARKTEPRETGARKRARFPDTLALVLGMVVLAQVLTYVLPPGEFEREGRAVVPGTFRYLASSPMTEGGLRGVLASLPTFLLAVPRGLSGAADIIFLIFIVGGVLGIVKATGALDALLGSSLRRLSSRPWLLVTGGMTLFAVGASTVGFSEQYLPFVPLLVTLCIALGMDAMVAVAMVYVSAAVGFGAAATNPFTVVIGQEIAGLETYSGLWLRLVLFVLCLAVGIHHVLRYAARVRSDPASSLVSDVDFSEGFETPRETPLTARHALVLASLLLAVLLFVLGSQLYEWRVRELSAVFLGAGLLSAVLGRVDPSEAARHFKQGAALMTATALLVGFARAIALVLDDGHVTDTIIHAVAGGLAQLGPALAAVGMLGVQSLCNLFIPSGSGQAYVTMPLMAPLSDLIGVTRQTSVLAFVMGDGFTNLVIPTNYVLMGMLGLGRVPYPRWLRLVGPLYLKLLGIAAAVLLLAVAIDYA